MKIIKCRVNHLENPIGYLMDQVTFSWVVTEAEGNFAVKNRVLISADEKMQEIVFDSGSEDKLSSLGYTPDFVPEEGSCYFWTVQAWDDAGDSAVSEIQKFETPKEFTVGKWIAPDFDKDIHPLFRKEFEADKVISARLRITGLGVYEAYLNGDKVGDEILTPYYNDYNLWTQYQTYDVTAQLKSGANVLGVMLGNGWYKGRFGFIDRMGELYGDSFKLLAELEMTFEDGSSRIIGSDTDWLCAPSPVKESSIYDGEIWDAAMEIPGWCLPEQLTSEAADKFTAAKECSAPKGRLVPRLSIPVKIMETIKPVEVIHTPAGETVIDFGQEITGWVEFDCREPEGREIFLQFGEILQQGNFYNENLRTAKQQYHYISAGCNSVDGAVHVRPHFTFYGFRYMKVQGISEVSLDDFTGCVIYSQMEETGRVVTSNEKVNRLFENALWGQKGNFLDTPTDCPQRDERMGWTGDAQVFSQTASLNMYTPAFYRKFLYDMKLEQDILDGSCPHVVPDILGQINWLLAQKDKKSSNESVNTAHGSCAWADAAAIIPWNLYKTYGDRALLEATYGNIKAWVDYIRRVDVEKCGGRYLWTSGFHFADWLALDTHHPEVAFGATDPYYVASVYYYYSASIAAKAAAVLGKSEDEAYYKELSEHIKDAIQKEFFTETGRIAERTQTAMILALQFNLVSDKFRSRLISDLKANFEFEKMHLVTGFVGTGFLCNTLTENGMNDISYTLLLNEDFPSWLYEVNMGATTVWERWNSVLPDGSISDTGMNSLNHYSYGAIAEWMYRNMCGVNAMEDTPGYEKFLVCPHPDARIRSAAMTFESPKGHIESSWEFSEENSCSYRVSVPFDTTAVFRLPEACGEGQSVYLNGEKNKSLTENGEITLTKGSYIITLGE